MKNNGKKYAGPGKIAVVNAITGLRFLASFLVVPIFKALGGLGAAIFSGIFLLTDSIDGGLARKFKASTFFGSIFDGLTDKTFMLLTSALLMAYNPVIFSIPLLMELAIIIVQNKKMKKGLNVKSNFIGKAKMWGLSISMVASLLAVDLLNLPLFIDYIKNFSLDKVASIKDFLIMLGINLPGIVMEALTLHSYSKELKEEKPEEVKEKKQEQVKAEKNDPEIRLEEIKKEKEKLKDEYSLLEKSKIIGEKLFDPEYYDENKDRQIGTLTRELFKKN